MVYSFPTNEKLWDRYGELRAESLQTYGNIHLATEFYQQNREAMDEGAVVAWPARFEPDELSAIQNAMNIKLRDEHAFWAEYQNEPIPDETGFENDLTAEQIAEKLNGMPRQAIPINCTHLSMFVDVQQHLLYYAICAWESDFTGYVVDYGTWPDQRCAHFTSRNAMPTLTQATQRVGLESSIYAGLEALLEKMLGREYPRDDGVGLRIERCMIDANWGQSTDVVYQFARQCQWPTIVIPSHGRYVGAATVPFAEYKKKPGDRVGHNWRMPSVIGKRQVRHILFDTNYWKSFVFARLAVAMGDPGCLSLFGTSRVSHRLFAEHMTAECRIRTEGRGRTVDEWKLLPDRTENHWFDCVVGCAVGASMLGASLVGMEHAPARKRERVSFAALQGSRKK